jgi:hypothetical protein
MIIITPSTNEKIKACTIKGEKAGTKLHKKKKKKKY